MTTDKIFVIAKPINRNGLRQLLGKEYFILKRKFQLLFIKKKFSTSTLKEEFTHSIFSHQSIILRQLQAVDMLLQENKRVNLGIAIKHINGIEIKPGEYFSLWKLVGRPTKAKGYKAGLILRNGKADSGTGGGLCQLGNLLFWIFAHSPLTITERHRHGFDVFPDVERKVPFGAGATLSYNYIDLQVKNDTENSFVIKLWLDDTHLQGELLAKILVQKSYSVEERNQRMKQELWGGYSRHNQIYKIISAADIEEQEELIAENHAIMMYEPFLNKGLPAK